MATRCGEKRLTPREMLRLQGFPERFKIVTSEMQARKQAGNSLPVNVAKAVLSQVFQSFGIGHQFLGKRTTLRQLQLFDHSTRLHAKSTT
jgi:hypothetical protein